MVSGWDRNPGRHNDYASPSLTKWQVVKLVAIAVVFYVAILAFMVE